MTTDELFEKLAGVGLQVVLGGDGNPRVVGKKELLTPALFAVLAIHKANILSRLGQSTTPQPVIYQYAGQPCLFCRQPTDKKGICWQCGERICTGCGRGTGSVFIELCHVCGSKWLAAGNVVGGW
jgi:hypothetical protein